MAKGKCGRASGGVATIALGMLCQCSLLFDLNTLDNGGVDGGGTDATDDPIGVDATDDGGGNQAAADGNGGDAINGNSEGGFDEAATSDGDAFGGAPQDDADAPNTPGDSGVDAPGDGADSAVSLLDGGDAAKGSDGPSDAGDSGGPDVNEGGSDGPSEGGDITLGLVAYYPFDEASGATSADVAGGHTATMQGATFSAGLQGNAATMSGTAQYVSLPTGIVSGVTSFSISAWLYVQAVATHSRLFDFGTGTTTYMFFTPQAPGARFAITKGSTPGEQQLNAPALAPGMWHHVAVTLAGTTGTLYIDGSQIVQNTGMTLNPASLGMTNQNWLGRSQFVPSDPDLNGKIDNFRIYSRQLSLSEVRQLYATHQ